MKFPNVTNFIIGLVEPVELAEQGTCEICERTGIKCTIAYHTYHADGGGTQTSICDFCLKLARTISVGTFTVKTGHLTYLKEEAKKRLLSANSK